LLQLPPVSQPDVFMAMERCAAPTLAPKATS
jgi:hypothetical protein